LVSIENKQCRNNYVFKCGANQVCATVIEFFIKPNT
jgi:hypothetical protein